MSIAEDGVAWVVTSSGPDPWQPRFEMARRRLVPVAEAFDSIWIEDGYGPLYRRTFVEAALPVRS